MINKSMKRCSTFLHQGKVNENYSDLLIHIYLAKMNKISLFKCWQGCKATGTLYTGKRI